MMKGRCGSSIAGVGTGSCFQMNRAMVIPPIFWRLTKSKTSELCVATRAAVKPAGCGEHQRELVSNCGTRKEGRNRGALVGRATDVAPTT